MEHKLPGHLSAPSHAWAAAVLSEFDATDSQFALVVAAAEAWDRAQQARRSIARHGAYLEDRFGQLRPHPGINVERDARAAFARIVAQLKLDADEPEDNARSQPRTLRGTFRKPGAPR
jgi:phage terminase small subunit